MKKRLSLFLSMLFLFNIVGCTNTAGKDIQAKTFTPAPSYEVDSDFVLDLKDYFSNAEGATYSSNKGTIEGTILTIKLEESGNLAVKVTASKDGKQSKLTFSLNIIEKPDENPYVPVREWNNEPVVKSVFYDDFSEGISTDKWQICTAPWGTGSKDWSGENVFYSTNKQKVEAEGAEGGIAVISSKGLYYPVESKRKEGAAMITRDAYGPGLYEVRMKIIPRIGPCTAAWTYWNGGGDTIETNRYSEIDIEFPDRQSYKRWLGTTYEYFTGWEQGKIAERSTVTVETPDGCNDGEWHTYAFEWRTDKENDDNAVVWYYDGKQVQAVEQHVPKYTATYWIGNWFPDDIGWVGMAEYDEAFMYVDWVRITQYDDPVLQGATRTGTPSARQTATNLGSADIPQNNYVSNSNFAVGATSAADTQSALGWEINKGSISRQTSPTTAVQLNADSRIYQKVAAQYANYKFSLTVDASVLSGSGKLRASVVYYSATVAIKRSEYVDFVLADGRTSKTIEFMVENMGEMLQADNFRVEIQTEAGTTAMVYEAKITKK